MSYQVVVFPVYLQIVPRKKIVDKMRCKKKLIYFRWSLKLSFFLIVAYVNLGTSLMADGRLAEAASALRAGSRADGVRVRDRREHDSARVSALVQLAALHSQRNHWHKALSAYKEALQILPETNAPIVGWTRHVSLKCFLVSNPNTKSNSAE